MPPLLTAELVRLGAKAASKHDAIGQAGALLVAAGVIEPGYVDSLHGRETVSNTYLGSGVAIPHGLQEDRHLIRRTGVAVLQVPDGVEWQGGERARLIVAIAAQSDEHIALLQRLTRLIGDPPQLERLLAARDPQAIVDALNGASAARAADAAGTAAAVVEATPADYAHKVDVLLDYPHGLHARPASAWVATAKRYQAALRVRHGDVAADPKNLVSLLQLGATPQARLVVSAQGADAADALAALARTIEALAAEEHARAAAAQARRQSVQPALWTPEDPATAIEGIGAGPGLVTGPVRVLRATRVDIEDRPGDTLDATHCLDRALVETAAELDALARETALRLGAAEGEIFVAQRELLNDAELLGETARLIVDGHGLAWAWHQAAEAQAERLAALPDPLLAARATDLRDVARHVLRHLGETGAGDATGGSGDANAPSILIAEDLTPSDTARLDPAVTLGFCTVAGGPTSHTAILARTLGVPAAVACGARLMEVADGARAVLDGNAGRLYVGVSARDAERARQVEQRLLEERRRASANRALPAATLDGHVLEIGANITRPGQVADALAQGADGVGLMRTEFLFLERRDAPDEDEQYACYKQMVDASGGRRLIIRTLDIGGDKQVPYLNLPHESNPFLGVRGLRLCLRRPDLFVPQLRALYRAAKEGPLSIMFPMVSTLDEAREAIALAETVRAELDAPKVPLGIMVETPSAAALADHFAQVVDFFSIGTNDLTQYVLAIDREHPELARLAESLHPAVLRMIRQTVDGARRHRKWVGVCGGLAGDPLGASILAGLGVDELSMSARDIAAVKTRLRGARLDALQALALRALDCADVDAVRALDSAEIRVAA
ncbi:phosphoenolpyruvate--protein phosphotransferase [Burkholderia mayonis]|uniref:phosphoenolpyruvate--protein phosphotransferase n=1 Tax=Burkholderia mayonis TaxID=1385591 RepID=A0A1B4FSH5_9BURK|nr:phosphoenolpyruvate--protein phosphotransferase [Burkholderia mayonis]AOJ06614.1 PTS fructose transporter subunit IIA [Burkholderia mayonis]KVE51163.1 PTS fructose transporter subunit IIA [Burkholderia mayonis]